MTTQSGPVSFDQIRETVREKYAESARRVTVDSGCGPGCCRTASNNPITGDLYSSGETSVLPEAAVLASLGRKWVTLVATTALVIALTASFIAVINGLVGSLASSLVTPSWMLNAVGMFVPTNFALCLSSIVSAHIARAGYDLAMDKTRLFNSAT